MNRYRGGKQANERDDTALPERHLSERKIPHDPYVVNCDALRSDPQASDGPQRYRSSEENRRAGTPREAPESEIPAPNPDVLIAERIQAVNQRITLVDHDASQSRELVEAADAVAVAASSPIASFAQRLEHLEQPEAALRRGNAVLLKLRQPDPPRPPCHRGPRYASAVDHSSTEAQGRSVTP